FLACQRMQPLRMVRTFGGDIGQKSAREHLDVLRPGCWEAQDANTVSQWLRPAFSRVRSAAPDDGTQVYRGLKILVVVTGRRLRLQEGQQRVQQIAVSPGVPGFLDFIKDDGGIGDLVAPDQAQRERWLSRRVPARGPGDC